MTPPSSVSTSTTNDLTFTPCIDYPVLAPLPEVDDPKHEGKALVQLYPANIEARFARRPGATPRPHPPARCITSCGHWTPPEVDSIYTPPLQTSATASKLTARPQQYRALHQGRRALRLSGTPNPVEIARANTATLGSEKDYYVARAGARGGQWSAGVDGDLINSAVADGKI
ncbi:hypothetical protein MSAN_01582200 [Mycena sanguinolenta]|uniref:Uncharacterized protein n=1 Tax=Mycena sanguinolenta TaxID=230812 RepID=A0A8H6Y414_9AGAR|nr:hypothetical protein MSAN_01582200 [Mycena sanguinolenta]